MELILKKEIDEEILTRIEYLHHMRESYKFIMEQVLRKKSPYKYDKENVSYYMSKLQKINSEFTFLSDETIKSLDSKYLNHNKYYIEYDFDERAMFVYEK